MSEKLCSKFPDINNNIIKIYVDKELLFALIFKFIVLQKNYKKVKLKK